MKKTIIACLMLWNFTTAIAQKPKSGTYTYTIAFAERQSNTSSATCTVIIKGNSIKVLSNSSPNLTGKKREIMAQGTIMKHHKTGKWIIGHSQKDKNAKEIGGCTDGPAVIDFKHKRFWSC